MVFTSFIQIILSFLTAVTYCDAFIENGLYLSKQFSANLTLDQSETNPELFDPIYYGDSSSAHALLFNKGSELYLRVILVDWNQMNISNTKNYFVGFNQLFFGEFYTKNLEIRDHKLSVFYSLAAGPSCFTYHQLDLLSFKMIQNATNCLQTSFFKPSSSIPNYVAFMNSGGEIIFASYVFLAGVGFRKPDTFYMQIQRFNQTMGLIEDYNHYISTVKNGGFIIDAKNDKLIFVESSLYVFSCVPGNLVGFSFFQNQVYGYMNPFWFDYQKNYMYSYYPGLNRFLLPNYNYTQIPITSLLTNAPFIQKSEHVLTFLSNQFNFQIFLTDLEMNIIGNLLLQDSIAIDSGNYFCYFNATTQKAYIIQLDYFGPLYKMNLFKFDYGQFDLFGALAAHNVPNDTWASILVQQPQAPIQKNTTESFNTQTTKTFMLSTISSNDIAFGNGPTLAPEVKEKKTVKSANINIGSVSFDFTILYAVIGIMAPLIFVILIIFCIRERKKKNENQSKIKTKTEFTDFTTTTSSTALATENQPTETKTLINTQMELSVPLFLEVEKGTDYQLSGQMLNKGGEGYVVYVQSVGQKLFARTNGKRLVAKVLTKTGANVKKSFFQEVSVMWLLKNSDFICKVFGYSEKELTLILKHYNQGSLSDFISKLNDNDLTIWISQVINMATQACRGLQAVHQIGFAHCDIKTSNYLVEVEEETGHVRVVLSDFGLCKMTQSKVPLVTAFQLTNIKGGSIQFASPEFIRSLVDKSHREVEKSIILSGDVFSFGMVCYQILCRQVPWFGCDMQKIISNIMEMKRPEFPSKLLNTEIPVLEDFMDLIQQCWQEDPNNRPNIDNVLKTLVRKW